MGKNNDEPITADAIEQFLIAKHWWLGQPHTRLAYRIIRWQHKRIAALEAKQAPEGKWTKKVIDK